MWLSGTSLIGSMSYFLRAYGFLDDSSGPRKVPFDSV
jgi:hypothetical protein